MGSPENAMSKATVSRMPSYLRYLKGEAGKGVEYVSSSAIATALGVSAVIAFITYLLPLVSDIAIGDNVMNILDLVLKISSLVGLGFGAFAFAARRGFVVKLLTTIFVLVFVVAIVLAVIGII